jgi:type II restriction enzyme
MREAILKRRAPNILALHYDAARWTVENLILVPSFAFSLSCVEKRKPLRASAERAGWVGCNILLVNIPSDARISVVLNGKPSLPALVRRQYARLRPLETLKADARGWTLDVLNIVRGLGRREFTLADVYARAAALARLHPQNLHVRDKIRQQLQVLRDLGFLEFLGGGCYQVL